MQPSQHIFPAVKAFSSAVWLTNMLLLFPLLKYTQFNIPVHLNLFPPLRLHLIHFMVTNTKFKIL